MKSRKDSRGNISTVKKEDIVEKIKAIIHTLFEDKAIELVDVEYFSGPHGVILRLYIDKEGGVTLDDCSNISHQISDLLDIYWEYDGRYMLEVSSPGIDRPLVQKNDFQKYKGSQVKIKVKEPISGQKNFKGVLIGIFGDIVKIQIEGKVVNIPYNEIIKAKLSITETEK
ncbi:MAG: ribosome maturation factor RimP [Desulfobacterales bacterium]|nr:ribosome maturation factor RimP [Desulfobacterales bacterium]